jgi:hypothetical protein
LSMLETTGIIWPSPRLRTLMDESVRAGTARVPACVALSSPGGAREVNWGSQRIAEAVVSWLAMRSVERVVPAAGAGCAVLDEWKAGRRNEWEGDRRRIWACGRGSNSVAVIDGAPLLRLWWVQGCMRRNESCLGGAAAQLFGWRLPCAWNVTAALSFFTASQ